MGGNEGREHGWGLLVLALTQEEVFVLVVVGQVVQLLLAVLRREEGSGDEPQSPTSNLLSTPPSSVETSSLSHLSVSGFNKASTANFLEPGYTIVFLPELGSDSWPWQPQGVMLSYLSAMAQVKKERRQRRES